jgi:hypothetical protein|tara:strand:+ start:197 stop:514 length:318 start_codon:yes stop_codon:yes gene_type:complete
MLSEIKEFTGVHNLWDLKWEFKQGLKFILKLEFLKILFNSCTWYKEALCNNYSCERGYAYETLYQQIEFWGLFEGIFRKVFVIQPLHYSNKVSHFVMCKLVNGGK